MAKKFRSILSLIFAVIFCFSSMGMASVAFAASSSDEDVEGYICFAEIIESGKNQINVMKDGLSYESNDKNYKSIDDYDDSVVKATFTDLTKKNGKITFSLDTAAAPLGTSNYTIKANKNGNGNSGSTTFTVNVYKYSVSITDEHLHVSFGPKNYVREDTGMVKVSMVITADEGYAVPSSKNNVDVTTTGTKKDFYYLEKDGVAELSMPYADGNIVIAAKAINLNPESENTESENTESENEAVPDDYIVLAINKGNGYADIKGDGSTVTLKNKNTTNKFAIPVNNAEVLNLMQAAEGYYINSKKQDEVLEDSNSETIESILKALSYDGSNCLDIANGAVASHATSLNSYLTSLGLDANGFGTTWTVDWYVMKNQGDAIHVDGIVVYVAPEEPVVPEEPDDYIVFSVARTTVTDASSDKKFDGKDVKDYFQLGVDPWENFENKDKDSSYIKALKKRYSLPVNKAALYKLMAEAIDSPDKITNLNETKGDAIRAYEIVAGKGASSSLVENVLKELKDGNGNTYLNLAENEVKKYFADQQIAKEFFETEDYKINIDDYGKTWWIDWYVMKTQSNGIHVDGVFVKVNDDDKEEEKQEEEKKEEEKKEEEKQEEKKQEEEKKEEEKQEEEKKEEEKQEEEKQEEEKQEEEKQEEEKKEEEKKEEPTNPQPTNPESTDPESTNPESTDPESTDPEPTNPEPTNPEPTNPQPSNPVYYPVNYPVPTNSSAAEETLPKDLIPLADAPELEEELPEDLIPLGDAPELEEELDDELVPLGDAPQTGDSAMLTLFGMLMLISAAALVALLCIARRESKKENNK